MGIINVFFQKPIFKKRINFLIEKRNMETTKNGETVKLVLPFPHFLWMLGTNPGVPKEETVLNESQTEQVNINRENVSYEEK